MQNVYFIDLRSINSYKCIIFESINTIIKENVHWISKDLFYMINVYNRPF